jgi:predicted nuclease of predicted toxin-antitoxin system
VPVGVAALLRGQRRRHEVWTAFEAKLADADDQSLIIYAEDKRAVLVTTNRDCALMARRMATARVIWLCVREVDAAQAMNTALGWLGANQLPVGRVLRVRKSADPVLLTPVRPRPRRQP